MNLLAPFMAIKIRETETKWVSPSNIAFVKYWGKKGPQLPANPSLSMTLKECVTTTAVRFAPTSSLTVELKLNGVKRPDFAAKIENYLLTLTSELPWLMNLSVQVDTSNTFPHGAGIASSASGLSAFALCLSDFMHKMHPEGDQEVFMRRASYLSRLASGSACRSVYGGFNSWGDHSDEWSSPVMVHETLKNLCDTILVVDGAEKKVSSRKGHERMKEHLFAEARFSQARQNFETTKSALLAGDISKIGEILEAEALSLHAMMMTSPEAFTLLRPNSLAIMEKVRSFRAESGLPVYFTLDAGPNVHLIHPSHDKITAFIESELAPIGRPIIHDQVGEGPLRC